MRVGDLSQALRVTVSGTSRLVDRIEQAGLLARQPDPDDRRAVRAALTPAGKRRLTAAIKTYEAGAAAILDAAVRPDEQQQMHDQVTRLLTTATTPLAGASSLRYSVQKSWTISPSDSTRGPKMRTWSSSGPASKDRATPGLTRTASSGVRSTSSSSSLTRPVPPMTT